MSISDFSENLCKTLETHQIEVVTLYYYMILDKRNDTNGNWSVDHYWTSSCGVILLHHAHSTLKPPKSSHERETLQRIQWNVQYCSVAFPFLQPCLLFWYVMIAEARTSRLKQRHCRKNTGINNAGCFIRTVLCENMWAECSKISQEGILFFSFFYC